MYCQQCGNKVEGTAFCTKCGACVVQDAPKRESADTQTAQTSQAAPVKEKKRGSMKVKVIIVAVLLVAAFVGGIVVYSKISANSAAKEAEKEAERAAINELASVLPGEYYTELYGDYGEVYYVTLLLRSNGTYKVYDSYNGTLFGSGRYEVTGSDMLSIDGKASEITFYSTFFSVSKGFVCVGEELWNYPY